MLLCVPVTSLMGFCECVRMCVKVYVRVHVCVICRWYVCVCDKCVCESVCVRVCVGVYIYV